MELAGARVRLVPLNAGHAPELRRILATPEVRRRWAEEAADPDWPEDDPELTRFTVLLDGVVAGLIQYAEEPDRAYRHASLDVFLDPALHGGRIGRDAVGTLARHLIQDRGHHRLVIDPAADNAPAIRCYAAAGFRPVGRLRRYERNPDGSGWHDGLLMELLAEDLDPGPGTASVGLIREVVLDTPDPWSLARFWAGVLGGEPVEWYAGWVTLEPPPHGLRVSCQQGPAERMHFDVRVGDLAAAHERVVALGARPVAERVSPRPGPGGEVLPWRVYADPAGHLFCLVVR